MSRLPVLFREPDSLTASANKSLHVSVWTFVGVSPRPHAPMPVVHDPRTRLSPLRGLGASRAWASNRAGGPAAAPAVARARRDRDADPHHLGAAGRHRGPPRGRPHGE